MSDKICKSCHEAKPLDSFYRNTWYPDRRSRTCKDCENKARMLRYHAQKEGVWHPQRVTVIEESETNRLLRNWR